MTGLKILVQNWSRNYLLLRCEPGWRSFDMLDNEKFYSYWTVMFEHNILVLTAQAHTDKKLPLLIFYRVHVCMYECCPAIQTLPKSGGVHSWQDGIVLEACNNKTAHTALGDQPISSSVSLSILTPPHPLSFIFSPCLCLYVGHIYLCVLYVQMCWNMSIFV